MLVQIFLSWFAFIVLYFHRFSPYASAPPLSPVPSLHTDQVSSLPHQPWSIHSMFSLTHLLSITYFTSHTESPLCLLVPTISIVSSSVTHAYFVFKKWTFFYSSSQPVFLCPNLYRPWQVSVQKCLEVKRLIDP